VFIKDQRRPLQQSNESPVGLGELVALRLKAELHPAPCKSRQEGDRKRLPMAAGPVVTRLHSVRAGHGHAAGQPNPGEGARGSRACGSAQGPGSWFCILTKIMVLISSQIILTYLSLTQLNTYL